MSDPNPAALASDPPANSAPLPVSPPGASVQFRKLEDGRTVFSSPTGTLTPGQLAEGVWGNGTRFTDIVGEALPDPDGVAGEGRELHLAISLLRGPQDGGTPWRPVPERFAGQAGGQKWCVVLPAGVASVGATVEVPGRDGPQQLKLHAELSGACADGWQAFVPQGRSFTGYAFVRRDGVTYVAGPAAEAAAGKRVSITRKKDGSVADVILGERVAVDGDRAFHAFQNPPKAAPAAAPAAPAGSSPPPDSPPADHASADRAAVRVAAD